MNAAQEQADHRHRLGGVDLRYNEQVSRGDFNLPRSRWSHMSDEEFVRFTEFEGASVELLDEYKVRMQRRV